MLSVRRAITNLAFWHLPKKLSEQKGNRFPGGWLFRARDRRTHALHAYVNIPITYTYRLLIII